MVELVFSKNCVHVEIIATTSLKPIIIYINEHFIPALLRKAKRQYLLTLQVSRYCLFALQGSAVGLVLLCCCSGQSRLPFTFALCFIDKLWSMFHSYILWKLLSFLIACKLFFCVYLLVVQDSYNVISYWTRIKGYSMHIKI